MRFFPITIIAIVMLFTLGLYVQKGEDINPSDFNARMENGTQSIWNITQNTIPYTNLYKEENINVKNIIFNLFHPIVYSAIVELNTITPLLSYIIIGPYGQTVMTILWTALIIALVYFSYHILKLGIILYFFIKEKRKTKTRFYE